MDSPQESPTVPTVLSFCSGYAGLEIGIERAIGTINVLAHVEIEAFAVTNLVEKMETGKMAPSLIYTDLKTLDYSLFSGCVDIFVGGYPCTPFSAAGKRKGKEDPRHLWPHFRRAIDIIRPGICFFENVEGHISMGLQSVLTDLEARGFKTAWGIFSAEEVGAPHRRKRVFIMADTRCIDREIQIEGKFSTKQDIGSNGEIREVGREQNYWSVEPNVCRVVDGCANRIDRLRLLGNGVVPATAELAFRTLYNELAN